MMIRSLYWRLIIGLTLLVLICCGMTYAIAVQQVSVQVLVLLALITVICVYCAVRALLAPIDKVNTAIVSGIYALKDDDYSVSIHNQDYKETNALVTAYNDLTHTLRQERLTISQRELLLDKVIQTAPVALILTRNKYVVYSNLASRELFNTRDKLEGKHFSDLIEMLPADLKHATEEKKEGLVSFSCGEQSIVYQLQCQPFMLHGQSHQLYTYQNLSREMSRKENELWKRLIRLISHELNNSLAPINSLTKSAKAILKQPEHLSMLDEILETIGRRSQHLHEFIAQYAQYSRLPKPRVKSVEIRAFYEHVTRLCNVNSEFECVRDTADFDPAQIEQVMLNLVKNAKESGSDHADVGFEIRQHGDKLSFVVYDRGTGMTEQQLAQALLPFYTTKPKGTGIGLTLCNEIITAHSGRLRLFNRDHGGLCVSFSLPL